MICSIQAFNPNGATTHFINKFTLVFGALNVFAIRATTVWFVVSYQTWISRICILYVYILSNIHSIPPVGLRDTRGIIIVVAKCFQWILNVGAILIWFTSSIFFFTCHSRVPFCSVHHYKQITINIVFESRMCIDTPENNAYCWGCKIVPFLN